MDFRRKHASVRSPCCRKAQLDGDEAASAWWTLQGKLFP